MSQLNDSLSAQFDRLPPNDIAAEMCAIASMMLDKEIRGEIMLILGHDDWYQADHQIIFDVMVEMDAKNIPFDGVILRDELAKRQLLEEIGGLHYLAQILNTVPSAAHGAHYASIVRDKSVLRQLIGASNSILREAHAPHTAVQDTLEKAEQVIFAIAEKQVGQKMIEIRNAVEEAYDAIENKTQRGLECGYFDLDDMLNGLQKQDMLVLAGRPSMGKTACALGIIEGVAERGHSVGFFTMEMSRQSIAQRMLCTSARIDSHKLRRGMLNADEYKALAEAVNRISALPIIIDDSPTMTVMEFRAKARRMKSRHKVELVVLDYMQLMDAATKESRQQQMTEISRGIKAVARELEVPVIAVSQLNRQSETREGHRPRMSDLRESGSIEQDADVILLLHREDYYHFHEADYQPSNIVEVIIAKQRNGPIGVVKLFFDSRSTRFENLAAQAEMY